jgi:hypothetical protein
MDRIFRPKAGAKASSKTILKFSQGRGACHSSCMTNGLKESKNEAKQQLENAPGGFSVFQNSRIK